VEDGSLCDFGNLLDDCIPTTMNSGTTNPATSAKRQKTLVVFAVLGIVGSLIMIVSNLRTPSSKPNQLSCNGLGQALAKATATVINEHGQIAVIILEDYKNEDAPLCAEWTAFCAELRKHSGIKIVATETVAAESFVDFGPTRARFDSIIRKHPQVSAFVSFCGIPAWDSKNPFQLPPQGPKLIVLENEPATPLAEYFAAGNLAVAIMPRLGSPAETAPPKTPIEWFNQHYQIFTPENYSAQLGGGGPQ